MRINSRGQVTVPVEIRKRLGWGTNTAVEYVDEGETARIVAATAVKGESRGQRAVRLLRESATVKMSTDAILALTRGD